MVAIVFKLWKGELGLYSCFALAFISPVPVMQLTSGVAGLIYCADVIGFLCAVQLFKSRWSHGGSPKDVVVIRLLILALCLIFPLVSVFLALLSGSVGDIRAILLGLYRGFLYLSVFWYCSRCTRWKWEQVISVLKAQILLMSIYCCFGIGQYFYGYNIDYWNDVRSLDGGLSEDGYGGGFMGLYRGAVGAWVAVLLSLAATAFLASNRTKVMDTLLFVIVVVACLAGSVIVGSRQGLFIGVIGLALGVVVVASLSRVNRIRERMTLNFSLVVAVLLGVGFFASVFLENAEILDWLVNRFGVMFDGGEVVKEVANRDPRFELIIDKLFSYPFAYIFGISDLVIVSDSTGAIFELIYVDSEFLWVVQKIGVVGLAFYLIFLLRSTSLFLRGGSNKGVDEVEKNRAAMLGVPVLGVCMMLVHGHYSFLHVQSSQAPVAYTAWLILGVATSFLRRRCPSLNNTRGCVSEK